MTEQMNRNPLVSVIIIFLNGAAFIEEAVASVFHQTYEHWELLLVDDGSTDESTAIALHYAQQSPEKVRYLEHTEHQNRGMSASRNLGISRARGEYIALLDADDLWLPEKLERLLAILESHPEAGMAYGPTEKWFSWTGRPEDQGRDQIWSIGSSPNKLHLNRLYQPPTLFTLSLRREVRPPAPSSVLIRHSTFKACGRFEDAFRGMFEDYVFFSKVFLKVPVFVTDACLDKYRQHSKSDSQQITGDHFKQNPKHYRFLVWLEEYLSEQGVEDQLIWQSLRRELWFYRHPSLFFVQQLKDQLIQGRDSLIKGLKLALRRSFPLQFQHQVEKHVRSFKLWKSIRHVSGLKDIDDSSSHWIVFSIVRNDELYIQSFIEHYLSLGIEHLVILDNDSIDNTLSIACQYDQVTVLRTTYQFPTYEPTMKKYLITRFAKNRPYIFARVDEKFDLSDISVHKTEPVR